MSRLHILHVVGARPNFMKVAPILRATAGDDRIRSTLVHTGQHYDEEMSGAFFRELDLPEPEVNLGVGSGTHAEQTAAILVGIERLLLEERPDLVMVPGDVNSTLAAALAAAKLRIPVAHVEAGLRSRDRGMPEEINRILTDRIADLLLTPSPDAGENLRAEGVPDDRIHPVGNVMIDTLFHLLPKAGEGDHPGRHGVTRGAYVVATMHRPSNVDDRDTLAGILAAFRELAEEYTVLVPAHPRTRERITAFGIDTGAVRILEPIPYLEMVGLVEASALVLTDSGGLQEETTALGVPCLTLRTSTERPVTVEQGTNTLVADRSAASILRHARAALDDVELRPEPASPDTLPDTRIPGWDGRAAERIRDVVLAWAGRE